MTSLSDRKFDISELRVPENLLPCDEKSKREYEEIIAERDKMEDISNKEMTDIELGSRKRHPLRHYERLNKAKEERIRALSAFNRKLIPIKNRIAEYYDYVNFNRAAASKIIDAIKAESIIEIRNDYTPQYIYSNYGGENVTEKVRDILFNPTVA